MTDEHTLANVRGGAAVGAAYGGLLGALIGWIVSSIPDPMPVIGPVVGQGVIATILVALLFGAGLGALVGALFGAFSTTPATAQFETPVTVVPPLEEEVAPDMEVEPFTLDTNSTPPFGMVPPRQVDMEEGPNTLAQVDIIGSVESASPVQVEDVETVALAQEDIPVSLAGPHSAPPQAMEETEHYVSTPQQAEEADPIAPRARRPARRIRREQEKDL